MTAFSSAWTEWAPLLPGLCMDAETLAETLDGGQSFRWHRANPDSPWRGIWSDHLVEIQRDESGGLAWRTPVLRGKPLCPPPAIHRYLGGESDWESLADALPWRSDAHLARCFQEFKGLRLLRQPFGETLLGFLCSATKQIVQIKQMMGLLAERHGSEILPGIYRLPTWEELASVPESELRSCLLGFRARFIHGTARFLSENPGWLEETERAPYPLAKLRLCSLPGVGEKVADCVLLFGAGQLEAFPVDVWILRALSERYGLDGWKPAAVAHFGRIHYGAYAGLAQQYLFAWERRHGRARG
ncbi:MAG TPA: DNA glycosylase [Opitutaceae bacterium]|nr:DNA glycosylase [Opitutaceae bacterium]